MAIEYSRGFPLRTAWNHMADRQSLALVLEETELGRWALKRALEAQGFEVRAVSTWSEASASLLEAGFSLALMAVSSAPGNVADFTASIRRDHPNTRLVLLVDRDSVDDLRLACGPETDILPKPFDLAALARMALSRPAPANQAREA